MSSPAVSVIVPVYNSEEYLERCLDSLVSQTLENIEILVVNDGSTDTSQAIIDDYQSRSPDRIVALKKPNGGLSDARDFGMAHATGAYIGFVDSDDYVESNMFEVLLGAAADVGADVAIGRFIHYDLDGGISVQGAQPRAARVAYPGSHFLLDNYVMVVWNKLYRASLIRDFEFPHTWFEDVAWTPVVLSRAERICYVPDPLYHYVRRPDSIASSHADPRTHQGRHESR
jgi:glycosyltransferase involved in cell wall biosynthesis